MSTASRTGDAAITTQIKDTRGSGNVTLRSPGALKAIDNYGPTARETRVVGSVSAERFHHVSGRLAHGRQGRGKFFHDSAPERVGKLLEGGVDLGPHLAAGKACSIRWAVAQLTEASASDMP